jgi:hypothetical protein
MTGFEWAVAAHLVMVGETEKGERIVRAIRDRYDGFKRNPWNEIECGSNYARGVWRCLRYFKRTAASAMTWCAA